MVEPTTYHIKTVTDFLDVPPERRADCLHEFEAWLAMVDFGVALALKHKTRVRVLPFDWIDDGLARAELHISDGKTSTPIIEGTFKGRTGG